MDKASDAKDGTDNLPQSTVIQPGVCGPINPLGGGIYKMVMKEFHDCELARVRRETAEECAKIVEDCSDYGFGEEPTPTTIAAAIRAKFTS